MEILNERPEGMSFEEYRNHLKEQKKWIKNAKKGKLYYMSVKLHYSPLDKEKLFGMRESFPPFKGKVKDLLTPINIENEEL